MQVSSSPLPRRQGRALFLFPSDKMGGAERVLRTVAAAALQSDKFEEIICFVLSGARHGTLDDLGRDPRVRLVYTYASSETQGILQLIRVLVDGPYRLVLSSHTHLNAAASLLRAVGVLRTEALVARESTLIFERSLKGGRFFRALYRLYGGQDLIVCQTERMAQSLAARTRGRLLQRTMTIPNPIDLRRIEQSRDDPAPALSGIPMERTRIAWCGRIAAVKAPLRAIDTLAALHDAGRTDAHLVMVGNGPMQSDVAAYAASLGLSGYLTLTGHHPAPAALIRHCSLGLVTSDLEGFPNVILEMLAAGTRSVVTTDCAGDLREIPGVHVSPAKNAASLARELLSVIDTPADEGVKDFLASRDPQHFLQEMMAAADARAHT